MATTLVELQGTPKQIEWAEGIRKTYLEGAEKWYAKLLATVDQDSEVAGLIGRGMEHFRQQAQASWWIDHRASDRRAETERRGWSLVLGISRKLATAEIEDQEEIGRIEDLIDFTCDEIA